MHVMNSHSDASLCITMEKGEKQRKGGWEGRQRGSKGSGTDKLHKWTNLPLFSLCPSVSSVLPPFRPPRRFSPRCWSWIMATLWRLPAPWVYLAQLEWRLVSYTTTHAHPIFPTIQNQCCSPKASVPASTLRRGEVRPPFSSCPSTR